MSAQNHLRAVLVLRMGWENFSSNFGYDWKSLETARTDLIKDFSDVLFESGFETGFENDVEQVADWVLASQAFETKGNSYTGTWCKLDQGGQQGLVSHFRTIDEEGLLLNQLGGNAILAALSNVGRELGWTSNSDNDGNSDGQSNSSGVPASDRIVTLGHNQRQEIEAPIDEVLDLIEPENSIAGEDGLRELVIGRLRAGRELIKAGIFSVRSLELTLIVGLRMLVERYGDAAIALVATKLLDMLLKQYGIG